MGFGVKFIFEAWVTRSSIRIFGVSSIWLEKFKDFFTLKLFLLPQGLTSVLQFDELDALYLDKYFDLSNLTGVIGTDSESQFIFSLSFILCLR